MDNKKTMSFITAGVLSLAMCGTLVSNEVLKTSEVEAVSVDELSAMELVDDMGLGWNLGNTFDSAFVTWGDYTTPTGIETGWGNSVTTQGMISTISDYGFDSIRIPITWAQMMDSDYNINEDYLARIKEVVDWCYEENMYVIINTHHDDLEGNWLYDSATSDIATAQKNYATVWTQIAEYFADYDNHLVFEGMNEPDFGTANVVALNQTFVDTVRATGGNNANRLLLISAPNTDLTSSLQDDFTVPDDDMIAVSIHYYLPSTFCVAPENSTWGYASTWGTDTEKNQLITNFENMKSKFMDNDIPVILGEYGVLTDAGKDHDSIVDFLTTVAETSLQYEGIASFLWDTSIAGDMCYFDRDSLTFFDSEIGQMYIDVSNSDYDPITIGWVETEITTDDDGIVAITTNGATKVKVEATCEVQGSGVGAVGYWDNNANDGKGGWVQDTIYIRFDTDEDGNVTISETDSEYETIINKGYFEIPASASTDSVQIMFFYGGYMDGDDWTDMTSDQYPVLTKAYIPGVASEDPDVTTTTDDVTTTTTTTDDVTTTTVTDSTSVTTSLLEPDYETFFGYIYPIFSNGVVQQWDNDGSLGDAVAVTGNGDYTITINIPEDGAAESILFLALSSDINSYQQNADEEEIFSNMTITVTSILVDGEEIEYAASDDALGTNDDGTTFRFTIYDDWSKRNIQNIDPDVVNTSSIVINFTIDGILNGDNVSTTEETTTATDDIVTTTTDDVTTTTDNGNVLLGDVNGDGQIKGTDLVLLKQYVLGLVEEEDINIVNADVNCDGDIKGTDLVLLKQYVLGLIDEL